MRHIYNQHTLTVLRKELTLIKKDFLDYKKAIAEDTKALMVKKKDNISIKKAIAIDSKELVSKKKKYQQLKQQYLDLTEFKNIAKMSKDKVIDLLIKHDHNPAQLPAIKAKTYAQVVKKARRP
jgi:S-adenosylmethionine synthetase